MSSRLAWIVRQLRTPPGQLGRKVVRRLGVAWHQRVARWSGERRSSFLARAPAGALVPCVQPLVFATLSDHTRELTVAADLYLDHRFDLLGSGWGKVCYGRVCSGLGGHRYVAPDYPVCDASGQWLSARINAANLSEAQRIWRLVDGDYQPIDWQLDFKSGYRWKESVWHIDIAAPDDAPGADIKVPWELARAQHLPQLALAYAGGRSENSAKSEGYAREFRNQVLDFLANNPPGFGVNWRCTMDVSIRVANWLLARDLFVAAGAAFDADFEALFLRSINEHGRHIAGNLEWSESGRSNHYLSNVVGLLIVAAYLPRSDETDAWSGWALRELVLEVGEQFDADGCNREGSTSYHRLSSEMAIYGAAFASRLVRIWPGIARSGLHRVPYLSGWGGRPSGEIARLVQDLAQAELPKWFWHRLDGMGRFVIALTRSDGTMPQVGDNDSGRFVKLQAILGVDDVASVRRRYANLDDFRELSEAAPYPKGNGLDHRHIPGALSALLDDAAFAPQGAGNRFEVDVLRSIAGITPKSTVQPSRRSVGQLGDLDRYRASFDQAPEAYRQRYAFVLPDTMPPAQITAAGFVEFGIFILRGPGLYVAFRCGPPEQYGQGSHLHHDQLSLELRIGEEDLIRDPGSFVYTPLPAARNDYRSLRAHFAPWPNSAPPTAPDSGLFAFRNIYRAECLYFQADGMVGRHFGFHGPTYRMVTLEDGCLVVRDFSQAVALARCPLDGQAFHSLPFSDDYGWQRR